MNIQNLIIFNYPIIFEILSEVENNLNFKIIKLDQKDLNNFEEKNYENFIFLSKSKVIDIKNQYVFEKLPLKLKDLIEQLNIEFLKLNYKDQSSHKIGNYFLDLNSKKFSNK